tara:strand:+ start:1674 stop:2243 length:570 start_codon:yes stop_codon:yes gene_type:complete
MKLIVGLGNPGDNYSLTKHNFGFWIVDELVKQRSLKYKAGKGEYVFAKDNQYIFIKPTNFMNNSGIAIKQAVNYYNIKSDDSIIVIYDDIDIKLGNIRFRPTGSDGGHNGIKSIIYHLKTDIFTRLKIGIGTNMQMRPSEKYVLKAFPENLINKVEEVISHATDAINYYLEHGIQESMNNFNKKEHDNE